jgi:hypothetical protein
METWKTSKCQKMVTYSFPDWDHISSLLLSGYIRSHRSLGCNYIKGGDYDYFFPLDGWKASKLYNITDPAEMVQFLKENNVRYIFDSPWTHGALWPRLPLTREDPSKNYSNFLGTYWFPVAFDPIPSLNNTEGGTVYYVGPITP